MALLILEPKDLITIIGITATLILSIWSLVVTRKNSKKTLFINTVTSSRIKFMENFRNNIAEYCGLALHIMITEMDDEEERPLLEKLDRLRYQVKLQLNRHDPYDRQIITQLDKIDKMLDYESTSEKDQEKFEFEVQAELDILIEQSQDFLKLEWEGVKEESKKGELSTKNKTSLYRQQYPNTNNFIDN